jgi:queuosine precursor transporter
MFSKTQKLFAILCAFFLTNALLAEFIGVKIFAFEASLGMQPWNWNLFGQSGSLNFTAGVMLWPVVFVMTDIVNEYFGRRGVRFISWLAVALISYGFLFAYLAIALEPADWWITVAQKQGVDNMQNAFAAIFGQGMWAIAGSITAFLLSQLIDVAVFHWIRSKTGDRFVWLRATGSTLVSQLIDSFVVLYIAFVIGPQHWPLPLFFAIGTVNYLYKSVMAFLMIPLIYAVRKIIKNYLGAEQAEELKRAATQS